MDFEEEIREGLNGLENKKQLCQFAWQCGVRALPFLSAKRGFVYWPKEDIQKHLYSVLNALDNAAKGYYYDDEGDYNNLEYDAEDVGRATYDIYRSYENDTAVNKVAYYAAYATDDAADTTTAYATHNVATHAAHAAAHAAHAAAHAKKYDINKILLEDIEAIKENRLDKCNHDISVYGELWNNFQDDLKAIGCGYWAELYENLFKNGFDSFDKEELKRRLSVPESIRSLGAAAVAANFTGVQKRLNEARIIILGEKGAGKTSLSRKLINPNEDLPKPEESTWGVDISPWKLPKTENAEAMNVRIWDFAGHEITHTAHRYFLSERCVYVIVYDGRTENRNDLKKWLNHIENYGGKSPVYIVVNIQDKHTPKIDENMLQDKFSNIKAFVSLSLKDDIDKVKEFRNTLENLIRTDPVWDNKIPDKWYKVKEMLEKRFEDRKLDLIGINEFRKITEEAKINDEDVDNMKLSLNALGICLWYDKITDLQDLVLNPNWISEGVYKIINWLGKKKDYRLHFNDLDSIFSNENDVNRYLSDKRPRFLFNLLKSYELAYSIDKEENELILPSMLSELQPEKGMEDAYSIRNSLLMRYKVSGIMPIGTIAKFIVRHSDKIKSEKDKQVVWRCGVALQDKKGNEALVIEDDLEIRLSVKGKTAKDFLSTLRDSLNDIFEKYKSEFPELEYVIYETDKRIYLNGKAISDFANSNTDYPVGKDGKKIDMIYIKEQYNITDSEHFVIKPKDSVINFNPPNTANEELFTQTIEMLKAFLESEQADELKNKDTKPLKTELEESQNVKAEKGWEKAWERVSRFLSDAVNIKTLGEPILGYIKMHPDIPETVTSMFTNFC